MLKIRTVVASTLAILMLSVTLPVFGVSHLGGEWTYGGHHDSTNWGAFSNYYHGSQYHWSYVGSNVRKRYNRAEALAGRHSYAFINTNIGESVVFDAGF